MAKARARRLAAAGAVTAFVVGGVSMAAGVGTALAQSTTSASAVVATCSKLILPCEAHSGGQSDGGWESDDPWAPGPAEPGDTSSAHPSSQPHESWSGAPGPQDSIPGPQDSWPGAPGPQDSWSNAPVPQDSWSSGPSRMPEPSAPWRPVDEDKRKVPDGAPQTGAGGLAPDDPKWPFAVGGSALLVGAGLAGFARRRRKSDA